MHKAIYQLGALALGLLAWHPASARIGAVMVQWGEVDAVYAGPMEPDAQLKALSPGQTVRDAKFSRITDQIEARLCGRFGAAAWLTAGPGDSLPDRVTVVVEHPLTTRPDGASSTQDSFITPVLQGSVAAFFSFENGWEMQPGQWVFEFHDGDTLLASKAITVTRSGEAVPLRAACDGGPVS